MSTKRSTTTARRNLCLTGIGCLIISGAASLLTNQADATPAVFEPLRTSAQPSCEVALPEPLSSDASERTQAKEDPKAEEVATRITPEAREESISYSYELTQESHERSFALQTSGTLSLVIRTVSEEEQRAEARLLSVVAWKAERVDTVFLSEVMASTANVTLSPAGAIREIELPESLSPEAARYWRCVLGRWQTAGPAKPKYAKRWRASERNEFGTYSALYEPDAERSDGTIRKIFLGYKSLDDANLPGLPMREGEVHISPGEHPRTIEGHEIFRVGLGGMGLEETLSFSFTRTR